MQAQKICPLLAPKINTIINLRKGLMFTQMVGDYKNFKTLHQEYATFGVKNFELLKSVQFPEVRVPVFSREGLNMLKIMVKDIFRRKTSDEKLLTKLFREEALKKRFNIR